MESKLRNVRGGIERQRELLLRIAGAPASDADGAPQAPHDRAVAARRRDGIVLTAAVVVALSAGLAAGHVGSWTRSTTGMASTTSAIPVASPETSGASAVVTSAGLDASGFVVAARRATVSSETTGRLIEVLVKEGDRVHAGQVLARLEPRDVEQQIRLAEAQVEATRRAAAERQIELDSGRERLRRLELLNAQHFVSEEAYKTAAFEADRLDAARQAATSDIDIAERRLSVQRQLLRNMEIVAPFDGIVSERAAQVGEIVSPISAGGGFTRTGICTLIDMNSLEVHARVNEKHIGRVSVGRATDLIPRAYPGMRLRGRVVAIMPTVDRETASLEVVIGLVDHDPRVLPNMSIDVAFHGEADAAVGPTIPYRVATQERIQK